MTYELTVSHTLLLVARAGILFVLAILSIRIFGKRSVARLAPFDLIVTFTLSAFIAIPLADERVSMVHGVIPLAAFVVFHAVVSRLNLRFPWLKRLTEGTPTLLIDDGKVLLENLKRERMSPSDLHILLREQNVNDPEQVAKSWMEPNGKLALVKRTPPGLRREDLIEIRRILHEELERKSRT